MSDEIKMCVRKGHEPFPVTNSKGETVLYDPRYWVPIEPQPCCENCFFMIKELGFYFRCDLQKVSRYPGTFYCSDWKPKVKA